jgi:hypothetical protein
VAGYGYYDFQNPPYMASRHLLITRIAAANTSFSPLPYQAWHGYTATRAHRVEVEVSADGPASALPSGAAAAAPPKRKTERASNKACIFLLVCKFFHLSHLFILCTLVYWYKSRVIHKMSPLFKFYHPPN